MNAHRRPPGAPIYEPTWEEVKAWFDYAVNLVGHTITWDDEDRSGCCACGVSYRQGGHGALMTIAGIVTEHLIYAVPQ